MQPLTVTAVADAFASAVGNSKSVQQIYDLVGPHISMEDMLKEIALAKDLKPITIEAALPAIPFHLPFYLVSGKCPILVPIPGEIARIAAWMIEHFSPVAIMNSDQMLMLQEDQRGDGEPAQKDLGISVPPFAEGISFLQE